MENFLELKKEKKSEIRNFDFKIPLVDNLNVEEFKEIIDHFDDFRNKKICLFINIDNITHIESLIEKKGTINYIINNNFVTYSDIIKKYNINIIGENTKGKIYEKIKILDNIKVNYIFLLKNDEQNYNIFKYIIESINRDKYLSTNFLINIGRLDVLKTKEILSFFQKNYFLNFNGKLFIFCFNMKGGNSGPNFIDKRLYEILSDYERKK